MPERATVQAGEKSAEVVVVANTGRRAEREGVFIVMSMDGVRHQMPESAGRVAVGRGEASSDASSDETSSPRHEPVDAGQGLLARVLARENMQRAWKRVKANKGAAGVDGMDIAQTGRYLVTALPTIRKQLMAGTYRPSPPGTRRVKYECPLILSIRSSRLCSSTSCA